LRTYITWS